MIRRLRSLEPGLLVSAAFIGPGTVTTASVAGADFGFALLWIGAHRVLERILILLVAVMGLQALGIVAS